jgi:hypothetical protein
MDVGHVEAEDKCRVDGSTYSLKPTLLSDSASFLCDGARDIPYRPGLYFVPACVAVAT